MEGDYQGVVPPSPLDGASGAKQALVSAGQQQLEQALEGDDADGEGEKSAGAHTEPAAVSI